MHIVYKHTCKANGKCYVGFTPKTPVLNPTPDDLIKRRWDLHVHDAIKKNSRLAFHKAIRKYGINGFDHVVLDVCETLDDVKKKEIERIKEHSSFGKNGYNMTPGGDGVVAMNPTDREKHRLATKHAMNDPELRARMKEAHAIAVSSPEHRLNNSKAQKVAQNRADVKARRDARNALQTTKERRSEISKAFHLRPETKINHRTACAASNRRKKSKQVHQLTLNGDLIKTYDSCSEAARITGFNRSGISNCATGRYKMMNGYVWKYDI